MSVLARASWAQRSAEFGELGTWATNGTPRFLGMELHPPTTDPHAMWKLWQLWAALPPHEFVLQAMPRMPSGHLVLRYAAIDWKGALATDEQVATCGIELTRIFEFVRYNVHEHDLGWFTCPFVKLDVRGAPRVGFWNPAISPALMEGVAPELRSQWPHGERRTAPPPALVFSIGQLLLASRTAPPAGPLADVLARCIADDPGQRFSSLVELRDALAKAGGKHSAVYGKERPDDWHEIERAIGYACAGKRDAALDRFRDVLERDPKSLLARACHNELDPPAVAVVVEVPAPKSAPPPLPAHEAHYQRAKELLALGRMATSREECERALAAAPAYLPAMLLRWQLDRSMKQIRARTGDSATTPLDLPEHLRHLRDLLVAGRTAEVIAELAQPQHAADPVAQLLRADLLAFTDQPDAALAAYEVLAGPSAALARATLLVRMGRAVDALVFCDGELRDQPDAGELHEGRALALQALGRTDEAEAAFKRALAADAQRSQMRVRHARA